MLGKESHGPKRNIILVEDSDAVRKSLGLMLRTSGYEVRSFASAEELLASNCRMNGQYLVVDYVLAQMNGIDLVLALRGRGWTGPVILITGFYDTNLPARANSVGIHTILEKPLDADTLLNALSNS